MAISLKSIAKTSPYSDEFFDFVDANALASARVVLPLLFCLIRPRSVIDIGCGRGAWLSVFQELGVLTLRGLDAHYPDRALIPNSCFKHTDLTKPFIIDQTFDLALCLEVLEHLPARAGRQVVQQLTTAAPLVLFSAAVPGQGGVHHVNEQWLSYWEQEFAEYGFLLLDPIRRHIMHDRRVAWWYRQNLVLFASANLICASEELSEERERVLDCDVQWINASMALGHQSLRGYLKFLPRIVATAACNRNRALASFVMRSRIGAMGR